MIREPKVACIETNCPMCWQSKDSTKCAACKARWVYLAAIEQGGCVQVSQFDEECSVRLAKEELRRLFA